MSEPTSVKVPTKLLRKHEKGEKPIYDVEPELVEVARLHAKFFLDRYEQDLERHWKKGESRNTFLGLTGQKLFDLILQQFDVPCVRNDACIDWRLKKDYDFKIPQLGTVEVKTVDHYHRKVLIKVSEWHGNDYCVILKFQDEEPTEVKIMGWLTKDQVEALPISKKGKSKYTPYADAYICDFKDLNQPEILIEMLEKVKLK